MTLPRDPAKWRATQLKSRRPKRVSAKRAAEKDERDKIRRAVLARDEGCRLEHEQFVLGACWGRLDCHEVATRARKPGSHLMPEHCIALCRFHHRWTHEHPLEAHALGVLEWSWEV